MWKIKRILCPVDFSEFSIRAYHHALSLAEHYAAQVVALHVIELSHYPYADYAASEGDYQNFCHALHRGGEEQLQIFVKRHSQPDLQPELVVLQGTAPDSILACAQRREPDLIVMGTHGRRGLDRWMLGTTTDRVMRRSSCPVLAACTTPPESLPTNPPANLPAESSHTEQRHRVHHLNRILLCTDFSENSERALYYALGTAREYDAELTLLNVLERHASSAREKEDEIIATANQQLGKLIPAEERKTLKVKTVVRAGEPYQQIIQLAEEAQTDLVVMAVRGRGALDLAVFGSTTYRVMQLGPCPVLAVPV